MQESEQGHDDHSMAVTLETRSAKKARKTQSRFSATDDEQLVKETLAFNPFAADFGSVRATWTRVATAVGGGSNGRRARECIAALM